MRPSSGRVPSGTGRETPEHPRPRVLGERSHSTGGKPGQNLLAAATGRTGDGVNGVAVSGKPVRGGPWERGWHG